MGKLKEIYRGNLRWLPERTFLFTRTGSQAYGTALPSSDIDYKGIAVPSKEYFYGFLNIFEQAEQHEPDITVYDIRKFFRLAADCNPNILEVMYASEEDRFPNQTDRQFHTAELLLDNRDQFLSRKVQYSYSGYAIAQLKRLKSHRKWLLNPPTTPPSRKEFGLPETTLIPADQLAAASAAVDQKLFEWDLGLHTLDPDIRSSLTRSMRDILAEILICYGWNSKNLPDKEILASRAIGLDDNFIELLKAERAYNQAQRYWSQYQEWKQSRNPERAEMEARFGYDGKHAMHLVRLMRMAQEILETGRVVVKRPDREELLSIRTGAWSYDQLIEWAEAKEREIQEVGSRSILPKLPDRATLDELCQRIVSLWI